MAYITAANRAKALSDSELKNEIKAVNFEIDKITARGIEVACNTSSRKRRLATLQAELDSRQPVVVEVQGIARALPVQPAALAKSCPPDQVALEPESLESLFVTLRESESIKIKQKAGGILKDLLYQMDQRFCSHCDCPKPKLPCTIRGGFHRAIIVHNTFSPPEEIFYGTMGIGCREYKEGG